MTDTDIPIDIHYNKLLDWLINRRHVLQQWQGAALVIREKINAAIQDMPPVDEITQLLKGTYINYFHCLRIVELLRETESGTKNIFGRYSSQRMKDWLEILKLYETNDVYLAEAAQLLMRNVNYEIPALKKQLAKCQQAQTDCTRKESEHASYSAELRHKFSDSCKHMGIEGKKVKSELVELVRDLPSVYARVGSNMGGLREASQHYTDFVQYTLGKEQADSCVPLLKYIEEHGNVTMFEYTKGKAPSNVEEPKLEFSFNLEEEEEKPQDENEEIDWGAIDFGEGDSGAVDISVEDVGAVDIDWGDAGDVQIEVLDSDGQPQSSNDGDVARGMEAYTILDNTETRNQVINELLELESFLSSRLTELSGAMTTGAADVLTSAPPSLAVPEDKLRSMLKQVQDVLGQLTSAKMQDLILIRSSPRYVDRLADKLKKLMSDADKAMSMSRLMVVRRQEAVEEEREVEPRLTLIRSRNKELQKQIEKEISKKYHNRHVNIMGEINTV